MSTHNPGPETVGRLLTMSPADRATTIRALSPIARRKIAHLAALGAQAATAKALEHLNTGRMIEARSRVEYAHTHAALAEHLTADIPGGAVMGKYRDEHGTHYGYCNDCGEEAPMDSECCPDGEVVQYDDDDEGL